MNGVAAIQESATIAGAEAKCDFRAAPCYASYVYPGVRGANDVEVALTDGKPIAAWSVIREASGRIRSIRIWTEGQRQSMRIRCAILHARKMHNVRMSEPGENNPKL